MSELYIQVDDTSARFTCDCCGWNGSHDDLDERIPDAEERLNAGCIAPAGACPDCGALAYYTDETAPRWTAQGELRELRADLKAARAAAPDMLAALRWAVGMAEEAIMCRELDPEEDDTPEVIAMHREALDSALAAIAKAEGRA